MTPLTRQGSPPRDVGSVSAFVVMIASTAIACLGLALDGGRVVDGRIHAADVAGTAARAGAQQLTDVRSGRPRLDGPAVVAVASAVLRANGATGSVSVHDREVVVTARFTVQLPILGLVGIASKDVAATRSAEPIPFP